MAFNDGANVFQKGKAAITGVAAGGSTLWLVVQLMGGRIDELNKKVDEKDRQVREYVDFKSDIAIREMTYLREGQAEIKGLLLRSFDTRLKIPKGGTK